MSRRGQKRSVDVSNRPRGSDSRALSEAGGAGGAEGHRGTPPTIEISDEDYRTLHLPCDALEESGSLDAE